MSAADGLKGFGELLAVLPKDLRLQNIVRVFEDSDYVVARTEYNFFGPKIGFDILRFENGKIVEHWENLQETAGPNQSGHTMTDGPTQPGDLDKTEANKMLQCSFVDDILVNGRIEKLAGYFDGDNYNQHNPQIADGLAGLGRLDAMAKAGVTMKYDTIHQVSARATSCWSCRAKVRSAAS